MPPKWRGSSRIPAVLHPSRCPAGQCPNAWAASGAWTGSKCMVQRLGIPKKVKTKKKSYKSITFRCQKIGSWNDGYSRNPITKSMLSSLSITSLPWILLTPHDWQPRIPANCDGVSGTRTILSMLNLNPECDWFMRPNIFGCKFQIVTDVLEYQWF